MANKIGIAYCGGIMTCSGYSEPKASNLLYDNPRLYEEPNSASTIINNTDADAFVYVYCDKSQSDSGTCLDDNPSSKLYVIKSSCSPKMPCTYYDDTDAYICPKIINDNTNIWAKEVDARYDIFFDYGEYELNDYSAEKLKNMLGVYATKVTYFSGDISDDLGQFKGNLCNKRYETIKNYLVNERGISSDIINSEIYYGNDNTMVIYRNSGSRRDSYCEISFLSYTTDFSGGSETCLTGVSTSTTWVTISLSITQSEADGFAEYIKTKRLTEINNIFGDISNIGFSANTDNSDAVPKVSFYAKKTIFSDYEYMPGNDDTRITNYSEHSPYSYFTNGIVSAEFSFINDANSAWRSSGGSEMYPDVPSATTIGMFKNCPTLVTCDVPGQMRYISRETFMGCGRLSSYTTNPDTIDVIDANAFNGSGIKTGIIGKYTVLKDYAFSGATKMDTIYWHNYIPLNDGFSGNAFSYSGEPRCRLDSGYTYFWDDGSMFGYTIPKEAFKDCHALRHSKFAKGSAHTETVTLTDTLYIPSGFTTIGESAFENCSGLTDIYLNGVMAVKNKAFYNCKNMNVHDTENVIYVGTDAFNRGDNDSREVTVYGGEDAWKELIAIYPNAFYDKNIKNGNPYIYSDSYKILSLPKVVYIGENAFSGTTIDGYLKMCCDSGRTIYQDAFHDCTVSDSTSDGWGLIISGETTNIFNYNTFTTFKATNGGAYLRNVNMQHSYETFANSEFNGNVDISACTLSDYAFQSASMSGLTLYHEGKDVNQRAFENTRISGDCTVTADTFVGLSFHYSSISGNCTLSANTIGEEAFKYATVKSLKLYPINDSIEIGESAFQDLSITLDGDGYVDLSEVSLLSKNAFNESEISAVTLPVGVDIQEKCFYYSDLVNVSFNATHSDTNFIIGDEAFSNCSNLTNITIPTGVTSIGYKAFYDCGLTNITIPSSVTSIGQIAFSNCSSLTSVTLPNSIVSIDVATFLYCSSLTSITIPSSVTNIAARAFEGCAGLTSVICNAVTPPELGATAFNDTNNCTIYVPSGSVDAYKAAWSTYASRIQAIP